MSEEIIRSSTVKRIDLTEFRNLGFLQEVNRQFLHPLGLALEMVVEQDGTATAFGGVWDYRDDPEGMGFADGMIEQRHIDHVNALRESKREARTKAFGDVIQGPA